MFTEEVDHILFAYGATNEDFIFYASYDVAFNWTSEIHFYCLSMYVVFCSSIHPGHNLLYCN